jgi:chitinase
MLSRSVVLAVIAGMAALGAARSPAIQPPAARVVAGYLFAGNAVADVSDADATRLTHINYAFANLRDGEVVEGFPSDADNFRRLRELRQRHPDLRLLVAVGGWTWSGGFSDAALTVASRDRFVRSAVAFVQQHDLDGLDIDWEYPGLPGNGNIHRAEDKENFTALMGALRAGLDDLGRGRNRKYLLTFAAGAFPRFIEHTELARVSASIDWVNLMTYDFRVAAVDPVAGHHANLFDHPDDDKHRSGDSAVKEFLAAGVPAAKLVLGVPFYGRGWMDVRAERNGLYQPGVPLVDAGGLSYGRIAAELVDKDGYERHWDAIAQQPYLWNASRRIFIAYDDPESVRRKARYVIERGLGGVMYWQHGSDRTGTLLQALHEALRTDSAMR